MKMKLTAVVAALATGVFARILPDLAIPFVAGLALTFLVFGISRSVSAKLSPLNDVPNAVRVLMASLSGLLFALGTSFIQLSAAALLFAGSLLLNDEYQRRAADSFIAGKRGGTVALLGIDGSGKSTHSEALEDWFRLRGYYCTKVPFHRYLFVEKLASARNVTKLSSGARGGGNPLRPFLSVFDNLTLHVLSSFGRGIEGRVVLYDRYIWSTYVKYQALGYPVQPLRWLYMLPRPRAAVFLDVPVEKSLGVIDSRPDHIRYRREVLTEERKEYLSIARETGFPVIDATREFLTVQRDIEAVLAGAFPVRTGARGH